MVKDVEDSAKANIEFATSTTTRAAEIIRDARKESRSSTRSERPGTSSC